MGRRRASAQGRRIEPRYSVQYLSVVDGAVLSVAYAVGRHVRGADPVPNFWGMVIATVALVQRVSP